MAFDADIKATNDALLIEYGKRYYDTRSSYAFFRKINDELCKEYGLSYMSEKKTRKGIDIIQILQGADKILLTK